MENNEPYQFKKLSGVEFIDFRLSMEAIRWLEGTTRNNASIDISNAVLFQDLLSRMSLTAGTDESFRRPQYITAGQAQFSEVKLSEQWNFGRKKLHNLLLQMQAVNLIEFESSRVASILTFVCVKAYRRSEASIPLIQDEQPSGSQRAPEPDSG